MAEAKFKGVEAGEDTPPDTFRLSRRELEKDLAGVMGIENLRSFEEKLPEMSVEEFVSRYPHPFLVQRSRSITSTPGSPGFFTVRSTEVSVEQDWFSSAVIPLKYREDKLYRHSLTVGRTDNNDVVLPRSFISKYHAAFAERSGRWTLTDTGSLNGTKIDGVALEAQRAYPIGTGTPLEFAGQLRFLFLEPADLFLVLNRRLC